MTQGTIMMQTGTYVPESLHVEATPYWRTWRLINSADGNLLDRDLRTVGWNFFFLADTVQAMVWGHSGEKAVRRVLAKVKLLKFNCLEITEITQRRFLGLPYVQVSAHSRHIQKSSTLQSLVDRNQAETAATWASG
ncbi:MAG: hypothetical protein WA463_15190 [Terriglobales bacterium]